MTYSSHDDVPGSAPEPHADAYAALLRREQQIDALQSSLGWRLLSLYGPYKRRFVLPAWRAMRRGLARLRRGAETDGPEPYERWAQFADRFRTPALPVPDEPSSLVTLVMAVDASTASRCERAILSVIAQQHAAWELLIARVGRGLVLPASIVDLSGDRVRLSPDEHESHAAALTASIGRATGAIVGILPVDVVLPLDALRVVARAFRETGADVVYTDEDHRDEAGRRHTPRFLPGWSPDLLLSTMYWSRLAYCRREVLAGVLPLDPTLDGAHAYDVALRVTERPVAVAHVPRVLAHVVPAAETTRSAAPAQQRSLDAAVARRHIDGTVTCVDAGTFRVRRTIATSAKISIVIPTRDGVTMLRRCLAAVERTRHSDFEVILVDNGSREDATLAFLAATRHRVLRRPGPFNFSRLNNDAVREAAGRYVLFLNDDTEPTDPEWLTALEEHAQRPEVGAVGARLLYADGRIQHAGIAVGIGGIAGHPGRFERDLPNVVRNVSAVTAACLMMRREVFDAVEGFDEALPVNSNDVDLCLRVRSRGYLVVYTPHAVVRHLESQTRGGRAVGDDSWLMLRRWRDVLRDDPYYSPNLERREESGAPDLDKPDGWTCLYPGTPRAEDTVRLSVGERVEQRFFATGDGLAAIVLRAEVTGPAPDAALRMAIRSVSEHGDATRVIDRSIPGLRPDERWFCFEPIAASGGRFWRFLIEVVEGHTATLRRNPVASDVMGPCAENGRPSFGTLQFQLYARAPYRCART